MRKNKEFHLVTFFFKNFVSIECNYEIYDKELLIIVQCFEQWESELLFIESNVLVKILIDYKNLEYFMLDCP
jgi:hypothetical protein